ncbi:MAG: hypothetical protein U5J95_05620 [Balneolaceae bacterium]|nr:hypothetical protein [Balneolaceae bacterium]
MGRAMLIICSGVLISLGYITMSTSNTGRSLAQQSSDYAKHITAKNAAHTAIQIAFNKMNDDDTWAGNHQGRNDAWESTIEGKEVVVFLDKYVEGASFWDPDTIGIVAEAKFLGKTEFIRSLYLKNNFDDFVPEFNSPLSIATDNFSFSAGGSSSISGNAPDGCPEDKPAVTVNNLTDQVNVESELAGIDAEGTTPLVKNDPDLNYQPTDELIARLKNSTDVQTISGNYKGEMGSKEDPGVFFVEDQAKLTGGISEGYGILVVRSNGGLAYEDEDGATLDIAGNFKFNGLVIFENAYEFKGRGTPTINGSVLVGTTQEYDDNGGSAIDININGNLHLQYDCKGEDYAKMAAAQSIGQNKFTRIVTYQ